MIYQIVKLAIYTGSILIAMYGLTCFNFDGIIKKGNTYKFYIFYFMTSISLGYLFASFILDFMTIHF